MEKYLEPDKEPSTHGVHSTPAGVSAPKDKEHDCTNDKAQAIPSNNKFLEEQM